MAAIRLHILQLSTGRHHPIASQPVIHVLDTSSPPEASLACVQIVGDLLGILLLFDFAAHPDGFALYNWKSGLKLMAHHFTQKIYHAFSFIAPSVITLLNAQENSLDLCRVPLSQDPLNLTVGPLNLACRLALPKLSDGCSWFWMWCKSEPNRTGLAGSTTRDRAPFHSDPERAIMIFNLKAPGRDGHIYSFTLRVHRSSLLAPLSALPQGTTAELPVIQWEAWGPAVCRWFEMEGRSVRWITMTCGQRFVTNDVNYTGTRGSITVIELQPARNSQVAR